MSRLSAGATDGAGADRQAPAARSRIPIRLPWFSTNNQCGAGEERHDQQAPFLGATAAAARARCCREASAQAYPQPAGADDRAVPARRPDRRDGAPHRRSAPAGLGQSVVIENRPWRRRAIGSKAAAAAEPDGYTLLFGSSGSLAVTPALVKNAATIR